jgi:hypothetical protein
MRLTSSSVPGFTVIRVQLESECDAHGGALLEVFCEGLVVFPFTVAGCFYCGHGTAIDMAGLFDYAQNSDCARCLGAGLDGAKPIANYGQCKNSATSDSTARLLREPFIAQAKPCW